MSSRTVKCASCNVVINEVLEFVCHVLDYMDEESIHQLVTTAFDVETISKAKLLLFESIPDAKKRMPQRRKDGKKRMSRDLDDMICLLKSSDPEIFPVFVAKDLHVLPSVSFDHIDCTRLLKDLARLQNQVQQLQDTCVTQDSFDTLKRDMEHMKHASLIDNHSMHNMYVNKGKRGACLREDSYELCSGPVGLQYVPIGSIVTASASQCVQMHSHSTPTKSPSTANNNNTVSFQIAQPRDLSDNRRLEVGAVHASESGGELDYGSASVSETARRAELRLEENSPNASCARAAPAQVSTSSALAGMTHQAPST